ncbi:MAG: hypothetical protein ACI94Y_002180, partial [Maribacter sp.]
YHEKKLEEKTGEPLNYWIKVIQDSKVEKHREIIIFLKSEHGFTYDFTHFVALVKRIQ